MNKKLVSIEMKFDASKIPSAMFIQGVKSFFETLEEITDSLYGNKKAIVWSAMVKQGSQVIMAVAEPPADPKIKPLAVSNTFKKGLRVIQKKAEKPINFSEKDLENIKGLSDLTKNNGVPTSIFFGKRKQEISPKISTNIETLFRWTHSGIGTIEGELRVLAKRNRYEVEVRDEISNRLIHCIITYEQLEDAKDAFERRVSITGLIHYREDGTPISIEVEKIVRFPFNRELPHHDDIRGIFN